MSQTNQRQAIRETILQADDLPRESVECPEWGQTLHVRTLTGTERDDLENAVQSASKTQGGMDLRGRKIKLVLLTLCDDDGELLFDAADALVLNRKSSKAIDRIFQVSQRLNGLTAEDAEELLGNSGGGQSVGSGSA